MIVVRGDVHLCGPLLSNTTALCLCFSLAPCLLPAVTNPEVLAIEAALFVQEISQSFGAAGWTDRQHGALIKHIRLVSE